ncbi:MAG: hypothetical protein ACKPKO_44075, partial [Candidatus Fonsibacter sp.]
GNLAAPSALVALEAVSSWLATERLTLPPLHLPFEPEGVEVGEPHINLPSELVDDSLAQSDESNNHDLEQMGRAQLVAAIAACAADNGSSNGEPEIDEVPLSQAIAAIRSPVPPPDMNRERPAIAMLPFRRLRQAYCERV